MITTYITSITYMFQRHLPALLSSNFHAMVIGLMPAAARVYKKSLGHEGMPPDRQERP